MSFQIAIDGPSGTGKSTIAKILANELSFVYIDTGAMYRAVGLYCKDFLDDEKKIINSLDNIELDIKYFDGQQKIFLNKVDVTKEVRTQEIAKAASTVSKILEVREKLVKIQQNLAENNNIIMDGRDIGTHVLKNANIKIFLVASIDSKVSRRCCELENLGISFDKDLIKQEIIERDYNDSHRENSPLVQAKDAILIDSSDMSIDEVRIKILEILMKNVRFNKK